MQRDSSVAAADRVVERVYRAVRGLTTGKGDVRARLRVAGATLAPLQSEEFPVELRSDFEWVMEQLTRHKPVSDEGRIEATMRRIQNSTGEKIAARIFDIYARLQEIRGRPLL